VDQFGYMIKVTDALDPCGFALFSDERGVVFEALPTTLELKSPRPALPTEGPASKDDRTPLSDR
jgi:hypothetical protein